MLDCNLISILCIPLSWCFGYFLLSFCQRGMKRISPQNGSFQSRLLHFAHVLWMPPQHEQSHLWESVCLLLLGLRWISSNIFPLQCTRVLLTLPRTLSLQADAWLSNLSWTFCPNWILIIVPLAMGGSITSKKSVKKGRMDLHNCRKQQCRREGRALHNYASGVHILQYLMQPEAAHCLMYN